MKNTINMTQGKPLKLLTVFALPLMFGNIFQQLYTVVDTAIVGRGVGMSALAALGAVDWLTWLPLGIAMGFTQGYAVRISQKYGQQDKDDTLCQNEHKRIGVGQAEVFRSLSLK